MFKQIIILLNKVSNVKDKVGWEETWRKLCSKRKPLLKAINHFSEDNIFTKQEQNTIFNTTENMLLEIKNTSAEMKNLLEGLDDMFEEIFQEVNANN